MNWNSFKTTSSVYWSYIGGIPAWRLGSPDNWVNDFVDSVAAIARAVLPADETTADPEAITVGPSPFTHIADTPQQIYISGGNVTAIEKYSEAEDDWIPLTEFAFGQFFLQTAGQLRITYTEAPLMVKDASTFNNAAGVTQALTPGTSPWTITAVGRAMVFYVSGGGITAIKRNGVVLSLDASCTVQVPRGGSFTIEYTAAPYVVKDS